MATLIKSSGEEINVTPKNNSDFQLEELQTFVCGFIEVVNTKDGRIMVINEEGKLNDLPVNFKASELYEYSKFDFIVGDVLLCKSNEIKGLII
jgi:hypothetical protein